MYPIYHGHRPQAQVDEALADCATAKKDGRELDLAGDVTNRVDAGHARVL